MKKMAKIMSPASYNYPAHSYRLARSPGTYTLTRAETKHFKGRSSHFSPEDTSRDQPRPAGTSGAEPYRFAHYGFGGRFQIIPSKLRGTRAPRRPKLPPPFALRPSPFPLPSIASEPRLGGLKETYCSQVFPCRIAPRSTFVYFLFSFSSFLVFVFMLQLTISVPTYANDDSRN